MVFKNLLRRKGRTFLTLIGICIGVTAIIALGALAQGLKAGFATLAQGSQADLVLSQAESLSALVSSVDERLADQVRTLPGVAGVDGMLYTNALIDERDYLLVFGYDPEGFAIDHFRIVAGQALAEARRVRDKPLLLGRRAAESMDLQVGDTFQEQLFDMLDGIAIAISGLAVVIGGITMTNTLWMSAFERTREIGVLRSLGWRRRQVLAMVLQESLVLGGVGGLCGIPLGLGLGNLIGAAGIWGGAVEPLYTPILFVRAVVVAILAGVIGGLYPAWRATRLRPVEALRYE